MKKYVALLCALALLFSFAGCAAEEPQDSPSTPSKPSSDDIQPEVSDAGGNTGDDLSSYEYYNADYNPGFVWTTSGITDYKKAAASQQGTVESLQYETPAYAVNAVLGTEHTITKTVNIYLPYGYDASGEYNILYLMHGGGDNENYWLTDGSDRVHGQTTRNVVDHMIEDGLCGPVIIVTPTFYSPVEGVEVAPEDCAAVIEELGEENFTKIDDLYTWFFQYELHDHIIPAVEEKYATYAKGDVSTENLIATRDHRAYAGLSMGSITSMHSVLMGNLDYISYVGSFSGAKTNKDLFKNTIDEKFADYPVNYWFNGEGVDDIAFEEHYQFYFDIMGSMGDKFVDNENSAMVVLSNGAHNYAAWIADLYNALLVFFQ